MTEVPGLRRVSFLLSPKRREEQMSRDVEMADTSNTDPQPSESATPPSSLGPDTKSDASNDGNAIRGSKSIDTTLSNAETLKNEGTAKLNSVPSSSNEDKNSEAEGVAILWGIITLRWPTFLRSPQKPPPDERFDTMRVENIDEYPKGYPRFAATLNSDPNFAVYRRFGTVRNRLLLYSQAEIARLERELQRLDDEDAEGVTVGQRNRVKSWELDQKADSERVLIIEKIDRKLEEYDKLIDREKRSLAMLKPTQRNYESILNWVWNYRQLVKAERIFLQPMDDFISLAPEQDTHFHAFLEDMLEKLPSPLWTYLFTTPTMRQKTHARSIILRSKERINVLVKVIVLMVTILMLLIPITILYNVETWNYMKTIVVCIFVIGFPILISIFGRPKNHELIAATAAYSAVLVVFLGGLSAKA